MHITQKDFRYPQTSARSECTQRTESSLHNPQIRIKQYRTRIREGNGSTWMRDFTIDRNHTISCRHWASSTFKFPCTGEIANPLIRTPHSTCHQHSASIDANNTTERVDGQECYPFNIYQTTPTSTDLPLNSTNNHHRWTLSGITARKRLFICRFQTQTHSNIQTQHSGPTQTATRQPNLSIASQQTGVSVQQNKGNKSFSST